MEAEANAALAGLPRATTEPPFIRDALRIVLEAMQHTGTGGSLANEIVKLGRYCNGSEELVRETLMNILFFVCFRVIVRLCVK